jgi:hypothetical protein
MPTTGAVRRAVNTGVAAVPATIETGTKNSLVVVARLVSITPDEAGVVHGDAVDEGSGRRPVCFAAPLRGGIGLLPHENAKVVRVASEGICAGLPATRRVEGHAVPCLLAGGAAIRELWRPGGRRSIKRTRGSGAARPPRGRAQAPSLSPGDSGRSTQVRWTVTTVSAMLL